MGTTKRSDDKMMMFTTTILATVFLGPTSTLADEVTEVGTIPAKVCGEFKENFGFIRSQKDSSSFRNFYKTWTSFDRVKGTISLPEAFPVEIIVPTRSSSELDFELYKTIWGWAKLDDKMFFRADISLKMDQGGELKLAMNMQDLYTDFKDFTTNMDTLTLQFGGSTDFGKFDTSNIEALEERTEAIKQFDLTMDNAFKYLTRMRVYKSNNQSQPIPMGKQGLNQALVDYKASRHSQLSLEEPKPEPEEPPKPLPEPSIDGYTEQSSDGSDSETSESGSRRRRRLILNLA